MRVVLARFFGRALSQTLPHLAILAVMLLVLAPQTTSFWQCEGQKCGSTAWTCCCAQPNDSQDPECSAANLHFERGDHIGEVGSCSADCHCTMVVQDDAPSLHSASNFLVSPTLLVAVVAFAPTFQVPVFTETVRVHPSRGPPPIRPVYLASAFLRGPPVA